MGQVSANFSNLSSLLLRYASEHITLLDTAENVLISWNDLEITEGGL